MLDVDNLGHASEKTKLFQRLTVIGSELVLAVAIFSWVLRLGFDSIWVFFGIDCWKICKSDRKIMTCQCHWFRCCLRSVYWQTLVLFSSIVSFSIVFLLFRRITHVLLSSFTRLYLDIHFQYNGFLLGILLISISCMYQVRSEWQWFLLHPRGLCPNRINIWWVQSGFPPYSIWNTSFFTSLQLMSSIYSMHSVLNRVSGQWFTFNCVRLIFRFDGDTVHAEFNRSGSGDSPSVYPFIWAIYSNGR